MAVTCSKMKSPLASNLGCTLDRWLSIKKRRKDVKEWGKEPGKEANDSPLAKAVLFCSKEWMLTWKKPRMLLSVLLRLAKLCKLICHPILNSVGATCLKLVGAETFLPFWGSEYHRHPIIISVNAPYAHRFL